MRGKYITKQCLHCKRDFSILESSTKRDRGRYCSRSCGYKREPIEERFWSKVRKTEYCWIWEGPKESDGYGVLLHASHRNRRVSAHRYSYELHHSKITPGHCVCHKCDNPSCVNPDHLFSGTIADNMHDRTVKGRTSRGEAHYRNNPKLNADLVRELRRRKASENITFRELGRAYGIPDSTIANVVRRSTWKHID